MRLMSESVSGRSGSLQQLPHCVQRNFRNFSPVATHTGFYQKPLRTSSQPRLRRHLAGWHPVEVGALCTQFLGTLPEVIQVELREAIGIDTISAQRMAP